MLNTYLIKDFYPEHINNSQNPIQLEKIQLKKRAKDLNTHFSKDNIGMSKKLMKRCSTPLDTKEMQIKTMMTYHYASI